jgi:LacI family transcriptional regulator
MTPTQFRVAVCIESRDRAGRERLLGVYNYALQLGWQLHLVRTEDVGAMRYLGKIEADGAILYDKKAALHRALRKRNIVCVETSDRNLELDDAAAFIDTSKVADMAFQHFFRSGYTHLAYCGIAASSSSLKRRDAFAQRAAASGMQMLSYVDNWNEGEAEIWPLIEWLKQLPRPVGVLTFDDKMAERVLAACRWVQIKVPEEVGVLGLGDDELLCELTVPRLSSIALPLNEIGRQAAILMEQLLKGKKPEQPQLPLTPLEVTVRGSTDRLGTTFEPVLAAVQFIKTMSHRPIGIEDVAQAVKIPRRTIERHFLRELKQSVHQFIIKEKLVRAKILLKHSRAPIVEVAHGCGYSSQSAFVKMYSRNTGERPEEFRKRSRP